MLRLSTEQLDWILAQQRERLAKALLQTIQTQWPALAAKLGDRSLTFVGSALEKAHAHGLTQASHAARYANLWCVWGAAFDEKPGFEWAAEILRDSRRSSAVKIQQLFLQSSDVLKQRAAPGLGPNELTAADARMALVPKAAAVSAWIEGTEMQQAEPRKPCDMLSFDVALGDQSWRQAYLLAWNGKDMLTKLAPYAAPPQRYRTDTPVPPGTPIVPRQIAALAYRQQYGHKAWLHVRCETDDVCDIKRHPRLELKGHPSVRILEGQAAKLVKSPLHYFSDMAPNASPVQNGLCHETSPSYVHVEASTCGLRRMGAPLGQQSALISVWPAEQWLAQFSASAQPTLTWPSNGQHEAAKPAAISLACDAKAQPVAAWEADWAKLQPALIDGVDAWYSSLLRHEQFVSPRLSLDPQLMHGQAACTWGYREAVTDSGSSGFLRVAALIRMVACATMAEFQADLMHAGAHARIHLHAKGRAEIAQDVAREAPEPMLGKALDEVKTQWRFPWEARVESLSSPQLATLAYDQASALGGLVGEAGLRPRPDGNGWQWYCQLRLEAATLRLVLTDPWHGVSLVQQALWSDMVLLDWSAG